MEKFKFKLEGLLKVRSFLEQKIKIELGELIKEIQIRKDRIKVLNKEIDEAYQSQHELAEGGADAKMLDFYPFYIQGKKEDIGKREEEIASLQVEYEETILKLQKARGEVKLIDRLKEKKLAAYQKEVVKQEQKEIEELIMMKKLSGN